MEIVTRERAQAFLLRGALTDAARVPALALPNATTFASVEFQRVAAGSSSSGAPAGSSSSGAPAVKKKPAANKADAGAATKKRHP